MDGLAIWAPILGAAGLLIAYGAYRSIVKVGVKDAGMQAVSDSIYEGAMAFLKREYMVLAVFVVVVALLLAWQLGVATALAFFGGAIC